MPLRCFIVSTSQMSFEKLTNGAEGKEKIFRPIKLQFGLCGFG